MKKIGAVLLTVLFVALMAGCGEQPRRVGVDVKSGIRSVLVEDAAAKGGLERKNTGVINETVADVYKEPDVQSERVTQAIFNQPVTVLDTKENWVRVKVVDGYTGWIKSKYMETDTWSVDAKDYRFKLVVTAKTKRIYSQVKGIGSLKDVVMGTELYSMGKVENWYHVALPGRTTGWLSESGTIQLPVNGRIPVTSASDLVATAAKFKGTVYLWGGVSSWGIDCSGLTYICCRVNGIDLPRDADKQYEVGLQVDKDADSIREGDLVFFSSKEDQKDISHVGIYIGNSQFIHASKSKGSVTVGSINDDYFKKRLVGVRRLFSK